MKDMILLAVAAIGVLVVVFVMRGRLAAARLRQAAQEEDLRIQQAVLAELDQVGALIEDKALQADALEAGADLAFARLKALRPGGELDPLIDDTRNFVREECARRRSA